MESSDEEGEIVPEWITNYSFFVQKEEPISFSNLPLQWTKNESKEGYNMQVFLCGTADNGLQKIYKQVIAWKFDLSCMKPEIYVLLKSKIWIKLQTPRKSFRSTVRTTLVTIYCLHFLRKNPEVSENALWSHLLKSFSSYEVQPSEGDLLHHVPLITETVKRDKILASTKYLLALLEKEPRTNKEVRKPDTLTFDAVDYGKHTYGDVGTDETQEELFDAICSICDNGGDLLCCEGRCMRSFHPTVAAGNAQCESLGFTDDQVEAIQCFLCKNCQYKQHQCFLCGKLGSSDEASNAEVFPCINATCGHFYHSECIVKLLHPGNGEKAKKVVERIAGGESFTCPVHKCFVCGQEEDKEIHELQFAMCRRCPKAYHRKCLPRGISFENNFEKNILQRAWDGLLPNRILIYCLDHKIDKLLCTPIRNHIIFLRSDQEKKKHAQEQLSSREKVKLLVKKRKQTFGAFPAEETANKMLKLGQKCFGRGEKANFCQEVQKVGPGNDHPWRPTDNGVSSKFLTGCIMSVLTKMASTEKNKPRSSHPVGSSPLPVKQQNLPSRKLVKIRSAACMMKRPSSSMPLVDPAMEKRVVDLMNKSTASLKFEDFVKKLKMPTSYIGTEKSPAGFIAHGKIERFVKAVKTALEQLEEKHQSIEGAKAVCEPNILCELINWKTKLSIYLSPFLHGMRYTSFGRHFTKAEKLKKIVERLHWYVQNGDMVVDFCCGANDFSWLMREKLDKMKKSCTFRNFDIMQSKNDFCFERRDWMTISPDELPEGSKLVMGLNPPFGFKASLANKFIDKALQFKPKLLILIVPKETERLDEKEATYDLIWEDEELLAGKAFYLPGSVDVNNKQLDQWNVKAPPLYLWSRPDWTATHMAMAQSHGHLPGKKAELHGQTETEIGRSHLMREKHDCYDNFPPNIDDYNRLSGILPDLPEEYVVTEPEDTVPVILKKQNHDSSATDQSNRLVQSLEKLSEMQYKTRQRRSPVEILAPNKQNESSSIEEVDMEISPPPSNPFACKNQDSNNGFNQVEHSPSGYNCLVGSEYCGTWTYNLVNEKPSRTQIFPIRTAVGPYSLSANSEEQPHAYLNQHLDSSAQSSCLDELEKHLGNKDIFWQQDYTGSYQGNQGSHPASHFLPINVVASAPSSFQR